MIDPGSVALGALCIIALLAGFVGWLCRGHRVDLRGVRVVRSELWNLSSIDWADGPHPTGPLPIRVMPPSDLPTKPEDFYEMAKERDPE